MRIYAYVRITIHVSAYKHMCICVPYASHGAMRKDDDEMICVQPYAYVRITIHVCVYKTCLRS